MMLIQGNTMLREIEGNITNSEVLLSEKLKLDNTVRFNDVANFTRYICLILIYTAATYI